MADPATTPAPSSGPTEGSATPLLPYESQVHTPLADSSLTDML